jgi:hypothetical protein
MISEKRYQKIIEHLLELEGKTGGQLLTEPRVYINAYNGYDCLCPIHCFAPEWDSDNNKYKNITVDHKIIYQDESALYEEVLYTVYSNDDSKWWDSICLRTKLRVLKKIRKWLRNR